MKSNAIATAMAITSCLGGGNLIPSHQSSKHHDEVEERRMVDKVAQAKAGGSARSATKKDNGNA